MILRYRKRFVKGFWSKFIKALTNEQNSWYALRKEVTMKIYSSEEAARKLGISVPMLAYHRRKGHIEGTRIGDTNMYVYTEEQIAAANLSPEKRGRRPEKREEDGESEESERVYAATA
jgi:hypothetical protein